MSARECAQVCHDSESECSAFVLTAANSCKLLKSTEDCSIQDGFKGKQTLYQKIAAPVSFLRYFSKSLIPDMCDVFTSIQLDSPSSILKALPSIIGMVASLRETLPSFAKGFVPNISAQKCPSELVKSLL